MDNYICINGKRVSLSDEQLKLFGIKKETKNLWIKTCEENVNYRSPFTQKTEPRYKIECPKCHKYFYVYIEPSESLFISHKYCGYCGHKNVEEEEYAW